MGTMIITVPQIVETTPMTVDEYNEMHKGFHVCLDKGMSHKGFKGVVISGALIGEYGWISESGDNRANFKDVHKAHLNFSEALFCLKNRYDVRRKKWIDVKFDKNALTIRQVSHGTNDMDAILIYNLLNIDTAEKWIPHPDDLLAEDWCVVPNL